MTEDRTTIRDLCRQWEIVAAKLALELLERGHEQETIYHLSDPAEARWREIEAAILDTEPDTIRDVDVVVMLRLARKIIGKAEYATSEDVAVAMLDLIDTTLTRRTGPKGLEPGVMTDERKSFDDLFAAWNTNRKQHHDVDDDEAERLNEQEEALLDKIVTTPTTSAGEIAAKVFVAKELIEQSGSRWTDARDVKVLDSVMEDLTRLCANDKGQP